MFPVEVLYNSVSMSQQKIEPLIDSKEVVTQDEERRGQALKMVKMGSSVSIMSRISKLLSCWVFHTVRQAARPPPLDGVLEVSSPTSHSISMLREQRSLVLAFFFFLKSRVAFYWEKKASAGITYKATFSVPPPGT